MMNLPSILKIEKLLYLSVWVTAVAYSIYCFTTKTYTYFLNNKDEYGDFTNGLPLLSKKRDKADFEWETTYHLLRHFYPWILIYIVVAEIIRSIPLTTKVLQLWHVCFTTLYVQFQFGYIFIFVILIQPTIFYVICNSSKNVIFTWSCSGISLILITYYKQFNTTERFLKFTTLNDHELFIIILCLCWLNLKCTSYYLEKQNSSGILNLLSYCLHPPTVFTGPFILYRDFQNTYNIGNYLPLRIRIKNLMMSFTRCLFWFIFGNFCLHFVYVNATSFHPRLVKTFNSWTLYGFGYTMGQFFHIKYVVLYGLSTSFASYENVKVPHLPRCIGRIHLYSDMWRYFDPGLYKFLVRHIYIPMVKICYYKLIASFFCFLFVYLWHGIENYILIWTVLNYVGITLEYIFSLLNEKYMEAENYKKILGPYWLRRIKCILASPLLVMSAISNFYFFAGIEIGHIFFHRIVLDNFINNLVLLVVLYCSCQTSTELRPISANKM